MKNAKERATLDDFELKDHYDFSDGVRGRFYKPKKVPITIRLDNDILIFFKKKASEEHVAYQSLINAHLRRDMEDSLAG